MPVWVRSVVPHSADPRQLLGYLERTFQSIEDWTKQVDEELETVARLRLVNGIPVPYLWDADTDTGIAPAAGGIKANSGNLNTVTAFAASRLDQFGQVALPPPIRNLGNPPPGGVLRVTSTIGPLTLALFIIGAVSQQDTDVLLPVVHSVHSGPGFMAGDFVTMQFWPGQMPAR